MKRFLIAVSLAILGISSVAADVCEGFGPQTPRDIDALEGTNKRLFSMSPPSSQMNLCNIHFHKNAEHKAAAFAIYAGAGDKGYGGGYKCGIGEELIASELAPVGGAVCGDLKPGDTIEVHWVHSSCAVKPGAGLGSCLADNCPNPDLRVETQVFTLVNDSSALDFNDMDYDGTVENGYHQPKMIPTTTGAPVEFLGSTTGPSYDASQKCSPLQVSWSVRPQCAKLDINSLGKWCESNDFEETKGHGVR
ncbi:MAG: delta-class carbonic anhydrase [Pseudomonadota bacterium]